MLSRNGRILSLLPFLAAVGRLLRWLEELSLDWGLHTSPHLGIVAVSSRMTRATAKKFLYSFMLTWFLFLLRLVVVLASASLQAGSSVGR
jgi:hypothetical protein